MLTMAQAGAMGIPFVALRGLVGSDIARHRDDILTLPNPFDPREMVAVAPPIRPDIAVLHALVADRQGNALTPLHRNDLLVAQASRRVVVTAEEVVQGPLSPRYNEGTLIPGVYTTAVVHMPFGAHPTACPGRYPVDQAHLEEYARSARDEEGFRAYLERFVTGLRDEADYLGLVGLAARRG